MKKHLDQAASILLRHVDTQSGQAAHAAMRARVVESIVRPARRNHAKLVGLVLLPVALTLLVLFVALRGTAPAPAITFAVGPVRTPGLVGDYLVPATGSALPLQFSEGSAITLLPSARGRVSSTTAAGAVLLLESGKATCEIVHRPGAKWGVNAGPFTVEVKGTSFEIAWDTETGTLELQMRQGLVVLRGPGVESGIELRDSQRFVSHIHTAVEPSAEAPAPSGPETVVPTPDAAPVGPLEQSASSSYAPHALPAAPSAESTSTPEAGAPAASWSALARRGDYRTIIAEAEARGIDTVLASGSDAELAALGDAARFQGRSALATRVLQATRARFPGSSRAASAAYLLGRMAEDAGNAAAALSWYEVYVSEAPGGALAPEALGRRMLLLRKSGNAAAARAAAETYLARFPKGPYSGVAREMTSQ